MIDFAAAQEIIAKLDIVPDQESVPLVEAAERILAEDLAARGDFPAQAISVMDGYAVGEAKLSPGTRLRIIGESFAGAPFEGRVDAGEAVRIFTGAILPQQAARVIIQENIHRDGENATIASPPGEQLHIRAAGSDFKKGDILLPAGARLGPRQMVAAAAADLAELKVTRRCQLSIIATGSELAEPGEAHLHPHAIPESVGHGVAALARGAGADITQMSRVPDRLEDLQKQAARALVTSDLAVICGGASVGERDYAKAMFEGQKMTLLFSKVAIKPGKPVWLGKASAKYVLGLPGNPTSAMVTARLFLLPLLARLQGQKSPQPLIWQGLPLSAAIPATGDRETFLRARWQDGGLAMLDNQNSGAQAQLAHADWLIRCPAGQPKLEAGTTVEATCF